MDLNTVIYRDNADHLDRNVKVLTERFGGLRHLRIMPMGGGEEHQIDFGEPTLLGVPFTRQGEGLADALFGIAV